MSSPEAPGGTGRRVMFPLLFPLLLLSLRLAVVAGHTGAHDAEGNCLPWVCSCYYYGVYYDEGDVWESPDDPCIKFKCVENGLFLPIQMGCSFKGECKATNSTWSEGCFRYRCLVQGELAQYVLEEAGCIWKDGNCYAVGSRAVEHCDTFECQIDGGCYTMNKVKSGCKTGDAVNSCKPMYSFWQDQCAVYQCTKEGNETLHARIQTHTHDVMIWPRGHYALPQPVPGCPKFDNSLWKEGTYLQCGDGCNYKSQEFHLEGNYSHAMFYHHFCVHHDINDPTIMPLYQTYWEPGRYCIFKYNGSCPKDFSEGYVEMFNKKCAATNISHGLLPDGTYSSLVTRMEFCCRYDGRIDYPIVLPAKHTFVLFMAENETKCQEVRGMEPEIQYWSFCDVNDGKNRSMNGSLPLIKTGDNNTLINFCIYNPIGCGCTLDDEEVVAVGDTIVKDCVTRICKQIFHTNEMHIVQGGCFDDLNQKCRDENVTWLEQSGEMCQQKKCIRHVNNETSDITFIIVDIGIGCRDGDTCYPLNYTKIKNCYHTQCQVDPASGKSSFVVTVAGCSDGHGHCVPDGAIVHQGCIQLTCNRGISKCGLILKKGACGLYNATKCVEVNSTTQIGCIEYQCSEYVVEGGYTWKLHAVKPGCKSIDGKCYEEGHRLNVSCTMYECIFGDVAKFVPIERQCKFEDKCYDKADEILDSNTCLRYRCKDSGHWERIAVECSYQGKCYPNGGTLKISCATYQCSSNDTHRGIKKISGGCKVGETACVDHGKNYTKDCNTYLCTHDGTYTVGKFVEYGCAGDEPNTCLATGDTFQRQCGTYRCSPDGKNNPFVYLSGGCLINGTCHKLGDKVQGDGPCGEMVCALQDVSNPSAGTILKSSSDCTYDGKCYNAGDMINDTSSCLRYRCKADGNRERIAVDCRYQETCYPNNSTFKYNCGTYQCHTNATHRWIKRIRSGCKVNSTYCVEPGESYIKDCNKYTCDEEGQYCVAKLVEYGCKNDATNSCLADGETLQKVCGTYKCSPDGLKNPYLYMTGGCLLNETCYKVGDTIPGSGTCGSSTCALKDSSNPSAGTVVKSSSGCVADDGYCMNHGEQRIDKSHELFCKWGMCHSGKIYFPVKIQCKTASGECLNLQAGESQPFSAIYQGKTCEGVCNANEQNVQVTNLIC